MVEHWPWYVLALAIINWVAVERKWKQVEYVAKPGTMILLLLWVGLTTSLEKTLLWFFIGGVLSLLGDVFLMLPKKFFLMGLVSFLLAHVAYIIGLSAGEFIFIWQSLIFILGIASISYWMYRQLAIGLESKKQQSLKIPILIYILVISLMVFSALMTGWRDNWASIPALLVSIGAILFYTSDATLAWDRFYQPLPHARLVTMITYHLGQIGIMGGAVLMTLAS